MVDLHRSGTTPVGSVGGRPRLGATALFGPLRGRGLLLALGLALLTGIVVLSLGAPVFTSYQPDEQDPVAALLGPGGDHLFGTDQFGRDLFTRVLYAGRIDLLIGTVLVGVALLVGTAVGVLAGWYGGWFDNLVARVIDIALAFPFLVLVICIVGIRGPGLSSLFVAVSVVAWVFYARLVRGEVLAIRRTGYIRAANASAFSTGRVLVRHVLPNVVIQPLLYATSDFVYALLLGASVSYLGLGVQPPTAEWGAMVQQGQPFIVDQWWLSLFPGLAIVVTGLAFSLIGDGLADLVRRGSS